MTIDDERNSIARQLEYLAEQTVNRDDMQQVMTSAVAEGLRQAVSDPELWAAAGAAMQRQAIRALRLSSD